MDDKLSYREKRRQGSVVKYLSGEARKPYVLRKDIARGLDKNGNSNDVKLPSCTCQNTLGKFSNTFKNMIHDNLSSTQKSKTINRNQQNKWLLDFLIMSLIHTEITFFAFHALKVF